MAQVLQQNVKMSNKYSMWVPVHTADLTNAVREGDK